MVVIKHSRHHKKEYEPILTYIHYMTLTLFICPVIHQGARGYHSSTGTTLITTSTTKVEVMVLVCNLHSILRSTMLTETSDSINPAYELTLTPQ